MDVRYRNCEELINKVLKDKYGKQIISLVKEDDELFFGIRDEAFNIYCCGASIAKICEAKEEVLVGYVNSKFLNKNIAIIKNIEKKIETEEENGSEKGKKQSAYYPISLENIYTHFQSIKEEAARIYWKQGKYEKICQQWIVNKVNNDKNNLWYCVDMEYNTQGEQLGRFDIIAISRNLDNVSNKHRICLIELKVGEDSYNGSWESDNSMYRNVLSENNKDLLYDDEYKDLKYGSGIVGHIADFLRFLANHQYYEQLAENVYYMLKCQERLGVQNVPDIGCNIQDIYTMIERKPEILIVSYDGFNNAARIKGVEYTPSKRQDKWPDTQELKRKMSVVLFNEKEKIFRPDRPCKVGISKYNLENALNSRYIKGFSELVFTKEQNEYLIEQSVNNENYNFKIKFVEGAKGNSWNCI